jgi:hypothetical protein
MSDKVTISLHTLPVELIYRILDNLDQLTILLSVRNICLKTQCNQRYIQWLSY